MEWERVERDCIQVDVVRRRRAYALEFLIAGCRAVQIGTANFVDPGLYERLVAELAAYLERHGLEDVNRVVGTLDFPGRAVTHEEGE